MRGFAAAQRAWDSMEAPECFEPEAPEEDLIEEPVCILGELACHACGQTGNGWDNGACFRCGGRGVVPCSGCPECGKGESPEVIGEAAE